MPRYDPPYSFKGGGSAAVKRPGTATPLGIHAPGLGREAAGGRDLRPRPRPARDSPNGRLPHPPAQEATSPDA